MKCISHNRMEKRQWGARQKENQKKLKKYANPIFDFSGITIENLFNSLLVKRLAFRHENEIRLLYFELEDDGCKSDTFDYSTDPHTLLK